MDARGHWRHVCSGGTRSLKGSASTSALTTVFSTWTARENNPYTAYRFLLNSPESDQLPLY